MYKSDISKVNRTTESPEFPDVILLDNTNACNLRCTMCDHKNIKKYRKIQKMDWDLYKKIIDEIAIEKPQARIWQIFYGDPFLCLDMPERIKYAKGRGLKDVVLNTNGVLMTKEKSRAVIEAGLDVMYVGIDAADKMTYEQIRVGGDFTAAKANTLMYRDLLRKIGRPEQNLFVQFVVSDLNINEVDRFKKYWVSEGVNVKIRPKVSWAGLVDASNLRPNSEVERKPCYWIVRTVNICADGSVAFCTADVHCRVKCGDANTMTIREIWRGDLEKYRIMHSENRFDELPPMCRDCSDWQSSYADYYQ
ncbi:MAG: radical SAM protein [Dehalococcoidia bacterium]|nr:radical SAM protein [Dehalococcoidia bacterium]MDD5493139.1 radical SAM protein [Dehalococcoidia bacterium]